MEIPMTNGGGIQWIAGASVVGSGGRWVQGLQILFWWEYLGSLRSGSVGSV